MNKLGLTLMITLALFVANGYAQKYVVEKSKVVFFSDAPLEEIQAENIKATSVFVPKTGQIAISIPINQFMFEKSLMQEHFNEKYLESEKYPTATFSGTVTGYSMKIKTDQKATAKGKLTIHGVTKDIIAEGMVKIVGNTITLTSQFKVKIDDYKIKVPQMVFQKIAEVVDVTIDFVYRPE